MGASADFGVLVDERDRSEWVDVGRGVLVEVDAAMAAVDFAELLRREAAELAARRVAVPWWAWLLRVRLREAVRAAQEHMRAAAARVLVLVPGAAGIELVACLDCAGAPPAGPVSGGRFVIPP
jgi:hypothetical protein